MNFLVVILLLATNYHSIKAERQIKTFLNPDCPPSICDNNINNLITLVHIVADGQSDSIHYVWDFTGKPSVLLAVTPLNTTLNINWSDFELGSPNSVRFSTIPIVSSAVVLNQLIQYNDPEDVAVLPTNVNSSFCIDLGNITWSREKYSSSGSFVQTAVKGSNNDVLGNGSIGLEFKCFGDKGHDINFPHLLHSSNNSQVDLILDSIKIQPGFGNARFAIELILVSTESKLENSFEVSIKKGLDDEHTPGVFEIIDISSPSSLNSGNGSYVQYRPVSYTHPERDVSTSTEIKLSSPKSIDLYELQYTLPWTFYAYNLNQMLVQGFNVSIGLSRDGFYTRSNYTTFTFVAGYGGPPTDELSIFIAVIAGICLILPIMLIIGGAFFICSVKYRRRGMTSF